MWLIAAGVSFGRKGGENHAGAAIEEKNLLGNGQVLQLEWESDVDRETLTFVYRDPHFLNSFNRLGVGFEDADDGETKQLSFDHPFYALDTRLDAAIEHLDVAGDRVGGHSGLHRGPRAGSRAGEALGRRSRWVQGTGGFTGAGTPAPAGIRRLWRRGRAGGNEDDRAEENGSRVHGGILP